MKIPRRSVLMPVLAALALSILPSLPVSAQGAAKQPLVLRMGQSQTMEIDFDPRISVADPAVVQCLKVPGKVQQVQFTGLGNGASDVTLYGGAGEVRVFAVRVADGPQPHKVLDAIQDDLARGGLIQISAEVNDLLQIVNLSGPVTDPEKYRSFLAIMAKYAHLRTTGDNPGPMVWHNEVTFSPNRAFFERFQKDLNAIARGRFKVAATREEADAPGTVFAEYNGVVLSLHGSVLRAEDRLVLLQLLAAHGDWLLLPQADLAADPEGSKGKVRVNVNVTVQDVYLKIECMLAAVSDRTLKEYGVNLLENGIVAINTTSAAFQGKIGLDRVSGTANSGYRGEYSATSGLAGVQRYLLGEGSNSTFFKQPLFIKNGDVTETTMDGRTMYQAPVINGLDGGEAGALGREIKSGAVLRLGAVLRDASQVEMNFSFQLTKGSVEGNVVVVDGPAVTGQTVSCTLGHTLLVGGIEKSFGSVSEDGTPLLRKIPILGWFFKEKKRLKDNLRVVLVLHPSLEGPGAAPSIRSELGLAKVPEEVTLSPDALKKRHDAAHKAAAR